MSDVCLQGKEPEPFGIDAVPVEVEVDVSVRVRVAISNSGYKFPTRKVIVNLAPANLRKEGAAFNFPIALAILAVERIVSSKRLEDSGAVGELSLDGGYGG